MRLALCQLNPTVGDIKGNIELLRNCLTRVQDQKPDLVILPELFITGYPPQDLLTCSWFIDRAENALSEVARISATHNCALLIGGVARSRRPTGNGLDNCAFVFYQGQELFRQAKTVLTAYDVFDEMRYFTPASEIKLWDFRGERIGISICEDAWSSAELHRPYRYSRDPIAEQAHQGATLFINIAASPFWLGKPQLRHQLIRYHCQQHQRPFIFVNQVGANDELIFDGNSLVLLADGVTGIALPAFQEQIRVIDLRELPVQGKALPPPAPDLTALYDALVLGIRDYFRKCGFQRAVLGISGGIDSAVVACLAVAALGRENVLGVTMPSEFSSTGSVEDSKLLARNLGIELLLIPITPIYHRYLETLDPFFARLKPDETEENIQARIRANILMALANKFHGLVLNTGNKSELAVGYCTLYGDLSGALAVIGDVPKTMVYRLAQHINGNQELIPRTIISKPPSAELRPGQQDEDTLPPYPVLDQILKLYLEDGLTPDQIAKQGFPPATVGWVIRRIAETEFKRQQAPPVLRVTSRAFGSGRRFPLAARYFG
jgi:NAD+ synthase (glutamine-hydrolysing)